MVVGEPFSTNFLQMSGYVAVPALLFLHRVWAKTFAMSVYWFGHRFGGWLTAGLVEVGVVSVGWIRSDSHWCWLWGFIVELLDVPKRRFREPTIGASDVVRNRVGPVCDLGFCEVGQCRTGTPPVGASGFFSW